MVADNHLRASHARADSAHFGEAGQSVVSGRLAEELKLAGDDDETERDIWLGASPALLHFVAANVALGASFDAAYGDYETTWLPYEECSIGVSLGAGINLPLGAVWSWI